MEVTTGGVGRTVAKVSADSFERVDTSSWTSITVRKKRVITVLRFK